VGFRGLRVRQDLTDRIGGVKRLQAAMALRNQVVEAVVELVTEDPPEPLVEAELERRAHDLAHRLEAQGASIGQYLEAIGQTEAQLVEELRQGATSAVKADLALRAVADAEDIEVSDDELEAELGRMAERLGQKPAQLLRQLERAEQMPAVRSDIRKGKALAWLTEHVEIADEEGKIIDRAELMNPTPDTQEPSAEASEDTATA
jgi:trigger factor